MKTVPQSGKAAVDALADQWAKLLAAYMLREGIGEIVLTIRDFERIGADGSMSHAIVVQELADGLHVHMKTIEEAQVMARANQKGFGRS